MNSGSYRLRRPSSVAGAAEWGFVRGGGAAVQFEHQPRNGQPEAVAAGGPVARAVEAGKGGEYLRVPRAGCRSRRRRHEAEWPSTTSVLTAMRRCAYLIALRSRLRTANGISCGRASTWRPGGSVAVSSVN